MATHPKRGTAAGKLNVSAIERELNTKPAAQKAFLSSPSKYLAAKGLVLNAQQRSDLSSMVAELKRSPAVALKAKPKIKVTISIRVRF
jgi:hypothetical protein